MAHPPPPVLSDSEREQLLKLARAAVEAAVCDAPLPDPRSMALPARLQAPGACFVTLTVCEGGLLRGCTGVLAARRSLAEEVVRTAAQTALQDPRFFPVQPEELDHICIEISVLTPSQELKIPSPEGLPDLIRPGIDGVTLMRGDLRATFLPQVWERLPDPVDFLDHLCMKMGLAPDAWRQPGWQVEVYQVESFEENKPAEG